MPVVKKLFKFICVNLKHLNYVILLQSKLDDYQVRKNNGESLNHDQLVGILQHFTFKVKNCVIIHD